MIRPHWNYRACPLHRHRYFTSSAARRVPPAFVFDIDGVLLRGEHILDSARNAFKILHGDNPFKRKIPYIFLTNGGGVSEEQRCARLSNQLGFEIFNQTCQIFPSQIIQSHTILKSIAHNYSGKPVLVLGGRGDVIRKVALGYGFNQVFTPLDILAWNPAVYPFHELTTEERVSTIRTPVDFSTIKFHAILVCHDPRNWGMDIQIMCDILLGNGYITGAPPLPQSSKVGGKVEVIFCNPDLLWKNEFDVPRLGQGGFKQAWRGVWENVKGDQEDPPILQFGKPTKETYMFAKDVLMEVVKSHGVEIKTEWVVENLLETKQGYVDCPKVEKLLNVYMVGDNPESDILGARRANWNSILVHTGVYDPHKWPLVDGKPKQLPQWTRPSWETLDVESAVRLAINEELRREKCEVSVT